MNKDITDYSTDLPFYYANGLRFECRRCSGCCRFSPGFVFLAREDIPALMKATGLDLPALTRTCLRPVEIGPFRRLSLREKDNYDCFFWENGGCRVYDYRPLQCRSYPFWSSVLASAAAWQEHAHNCPGMGVGRLHSAETISRWLEQRQEERLIELGLGDDGDFEKAIAKWLDG